MSNTVNYDKLHQRGLSTVSAIPSSSIPNQHPNPTISSHLPNTIHSRYAVISPVRDEASHIDKTLKSMLAQTSLPVKWVIVDDGSKDQTVARIKSVMHLAPFVELIQNRRQTGREVGSGVIRAFNQGLERLEGIAYKYIVKLDGDLSFEPTYFQDLLSRMDAHPKFGVASGVYMERCNNDQWRDIRMPEYHAAGACKAVRLTCFMEIGGFIPQRGWDTVDELRAITRGWQTGHFHDLKMRHWKIEGSSIGFWRTSIMHGEIFYRAGGGAVLFIPKVLSRLFSRPLLIAGLAMAWGFIRSALLRSPKLVSGKEAQTYRKLLRRRLTKLFVNVPDSIGLH